MYDVIVALGGGDDRKLKAIELLKSGLSDRILFTGEPNIYQAYSNFKVPLYMQVIPKFISVDTWGDGDVIGEVMNSNNWWSALIVTSNYHILRAKLIFRKDIPKRRLSYIGVPSPTSPKILWKEFTGILRAMVTR